MASRARAQISKRSRGPGCLVGECCKWLDAISTEKGIQQQRLGSSKTLVPQSTQPLSLSLTAIPWYSRPTCFVPWHPWAERYLYIRPEAKAKLGKNMIWRTKPSGGHSTDCTKTARPGSAGCSTSLPSVLCLVPLGRESKHRMLLVPVREKIQVELRHFSTSAPPFPWQGNDLPVNGKYSRSY